MTHKFRSAALIVAAGMTALGLTSCASAAPPPPQRPSIAWETCDDATPHGLECGELAVPADWDDPTGPSVTLHMARRPATDAAHRVGTLLLNDAAGGSSIEQLRYAQSFGIGQTELARRFDIVALDLRGIGHSDPLACADAPDRPAGISMFPTSPAQFAALVAANKALAARCSAGHPELFAHLDMSSVARDVDTVRIGLGESQLSWYGIHYSAALGTVYARMFPGRLRAIVNDSALDVTTSGVERLSAEITTAEQSFNRFVAWCNAQPSPAGCALAGNDVASDFDRLTAAADRTPIPAGPGRTLDGDGIRAAAQDYLNIKQPQWPAFAAALRSAMNGDATPLTVPQDKTLNRIEARTHACADTPPIVDDVAGVRALTTMARGLSPHLRGAVNGWQHLVGCIGWPVPAAAVDSAPVSSAPPALFLASVHQSSSAYSWSFGAATQIPGSAVLSRDADDYSMFLLSPCAQSAMTTYLVDLRLPRPGQRCDD